MNGFGSDSRAYDSVGTGARFTNGVCHWLAAQLSTDSHSLRAAGASMGMADESANASRQPIFRPGRLWCHPYSLRVLEDVVSRPAPTRRLCIPVRPSSACHSRSGNWARAISMPKTTQIERPLSRPLGVAFLHGRFVGKYAAIFKYRESRARAGPDRDSARAALRDAPPSSRLSRAPAGGVRNYGSVSGAIHAHDDVQPGRPPVAPYGAWLGAGAKRKDRLRNPVGHWIDFCKRRAREMR